MAKTPQAVEQCYELLKWLMPVVDNFPRSRKYVLGERLLNRLLDVLELLLAASYARQKAPLLQKANQRLQTVRYVWRLSYDLKLIDARRYEFAAKQMITIGQQLGAWQKQRTRDE